MSLAPLDDREGSLRPQAPQLSLPEQLTDEFYAWERRGRGWQVWPYAVELEPPYRPFFHSLPARRALVDDGRRPTLLSALIERIRARARTSPATEPLEFDLPEPEAEPFDDSVPLVELQVSLAPDTRVTRGATEQFLVSLTHSVRPVGFELVGIFGAVLVQVVCRELDRSVVREQLKAHFPEAIATDETGFLEKTWGLASGEPTVVDFGLSREFMLGLRTFKDFDVDPLIASVGALADMRAGEIGVLQLSFQAARYPWAESILRAVRDAEGGAFFADAPEMVPYAREKVARPLFAVGVRVAARSPQSGRVWPIVRALGGALHQFSSPSENELLPLSNDDYDDATHVTDLLCRRTHRSGMILNSEELASLVHLPSASVRSEKLKRETTRTRGAAARASGGTLLLGENLHAGVSTPITLSTVERLKHTYLIGASGTGKSTLLLNMIVQDIEEGQGLAVLDPHGDLIEDVLGHIPEGRHADVVLFDPADAEYPVGFNILAAHSEIEEQLLASDLVAGFRRLSTSWGDQMTSVLGNAILAFLESDEGGTLVDLRRFLVEPAFRKKFLETVRDREVVYFWEREFPLLAGRPQAPILTRLDTFLRPKLVRYMVAQKGNRLDLGALMNAGKIFLAKLSQGTIGEENAHLLGTLLVSKFHQMAMSRQELPAADRRPFYLYVDEFHHFMTPSMAGILSGTRKYGLGLVLAHQDLRQVAKDPDVLGAVIGNPYTRVCFRVGELDARKLEDGFSHFEARDLQNLGVGEAVCRIERAECDFNLKARPVPAVDPTLARERREVVMALSRARYATPRAEVEATLRDAMTEPLSAPDPGKTQTHPSERPATRRTAGIAPMPSAAPLPEVSQRVSPPPPSPGRGGSQHKYLQSLIKRWAESRSWRATVEKSILDGLGSVDVALERGDMTVACEIAVASTAEQELGNVQKCLAAGFHYVASVSMERREATRLQGFVAGRLGAGELTQVRFVTPEELFDFLGGLDAQTAGGEGTVRGWKVKRRHRAGGTEEQASKRRAIAKVMIDTLGRLRRGRVE